MSSVDLIDVHGVIARTTLSKTQIYRMGRSGQDGFPKPYRLSSQRLAWDAAEVDAWIDTQRQRR